jgi:hypothetical protein
VKSKFLLQPGCIGYSDLLDSPSALRGKLETRDVCRRRASLRKCVNMQDILGGVTRLKLHSIRFLSALNLIGPPYQASKRFYPYVFRNKQIGHSCCP